MPTRTPHQVMLAVGDEGRYLLFISKTCIQASAAKSARSLLKRWRGAGVLSQNKLLPHLGALQAWWEAAIFISATGSCFGFTALQPYLWLFFC